jgi:hypothetical protein
MGETGPSKMALYSLTGHANSPFHAEPAHCQRWHLADNKTLDCTLAYEKLVSDLIKFWAVCPQTTPVSNGGGSCF